ncbi:MAG: protoporphyrinogen oxidase [Bacteroidetes bacterium]|nr:protoporphyrinogen oxidase [Bacteroidota bacterium]
MLDAIVIGAGISGLATGYYLAIAGKKFVILERSSEVGGLIRTEHLDGYTLEHGPNSLRGDSVELQEIIDGVGLREAVRPPVITRTKNYIATGGRLVQVPRSPIDLLSTKLLSGKAKRYLLAEPFHAAHAVEDESVASFFRRRAGTEAVEMLIKPLMSGIYAGDAEQLSVRSAFPKFYEYERTHGSLLRGMMKAKKKQRPNLPRMFSFDEGLSQLPSALHSTLRSQIRLGISISSIQQREAVWLVELSNGELIEAKNLILTTPLEQTTNLLRGVIADALPLVYRPPISIVYLGFKTTSIPRPLDGFGFLVAPSENSDILGCIYTSALFPNRAPMGKSMVTVLMGGARRPDICNLSKEEIETRAIKTLAAYLGTPTVAAFVHSHTWEHSIPQYNLGHWRTIEALDAYEHQFPGLHFGGNYRGGISIGSCITTAKSIATTVIGQ